MGQRYAIEDVMRMEKRIARLEQQLRETEQQRDEAGQRYVKAIAECAEKQRRIAELEEMLRKKCLQCGSECEPLPICDKCTNDRLEWGDKRIAELEAKLEALQHRIHRYASTPEARVHAVEQENTRLREALEKEKQNEHQS